MQRKASVISLMSLLLPFIMYYPSFIDTYIYVFIKIVMLVLAVIYLCLNSKLTVSLLFKLKWLSFLFLSLLFTVFYYLIFLVLGYYYDIEQCVNICILILYSLMGSIFYYNIKDLLIALRVIPLVTAVLAIITIFYFNVGFELTEQYLVDFKNTFGVLCSTGAIISLYYFLKFRQKTYLLCYLIIVLSIILFRARTTTVALLCMSVYVYFKLSKTSITKSLIILILGLFIANFILLYVSGYSISDILYDSFFKGRDVTDIDSITSGRAYRNNIALDVFMNNPFFGLSISMKQIPWPHNFLLCQLSYYGLIGSFIFLLIYAYISIDVIYNLVKIKTITHCNLSYICLSILLIVSIAEPTYPFAPGTTVYIAFLLYGFTKMNKTNDFKN